MTDQSPSNASNPEPAPSLTPDLAQISTNARPSGGRGGRGSRRPGRGGNRNSRNRTTITKFKGETERMNGHVFSTPEESNDPMEYIRTSEMAERYMNKEYDLIEMSSIFEDPPSTPSVEAPKTINEESTQLEKDLYPLRLKAYLTREYELQTAMRSFWAVLWGQCTEALIMKLEDINNMKT